MDLKPIPSFYCCYLLRSSTRPSSLYIGSTPNPRRRLAQHNGEVKGGAARTSDSRFRPWEMTCLVAGFPSQVAALQFEWAWQNAHLTRHIRNAERVSRSAYNNENLGNADRDQKPTKKPRLSLRRSLENLRLLLYTPYFASWPIELCFLSQPVQQTWRVMCERADNNIPTTIDIQTLLPGPEHKALVDGDKDNQPEQWSWTPKDTNILDQVADRKYRSLGPFLEKAKATFSDETMLLCTLCGQNLHPGRSLVVTCPGSACEGVYHVTCLSSHFLRAENACSLVPVSGNCPCCETHISWSQLMKELTLRTRYSDVERKALVCKSRRKCSTILPGTSHYARTSEESDSSEESDICEENSVSDIAVKGQEATQPDDDVISSISSEPNTSIFAASAQASKIRPGKDQIVVIEDSEDDCQDMLDMSSST